MCDFTIFNQALVLRVVRLRASDLTFGTRCSLVPELEGPGLGTSSQAIAIDQKGYRPTGATGFISRTTKGNFEFGPCTNNRVFTFPSSQINPKAHPHLYSTQGQRRSAGLPMRCISESVELEKALLREPRLLRNRVAFAFHPVPVPWPSG